MKLRGKPSQPIEIIHQALFGVLARVVENPDGARVPAFRDDPEQLQILRSRGQRQDLAPHLVPPYVHSIQI